MIYALHSPSLRYIPISRTLKLTSGGRSEGKSRSQRSYTVKCGSRIVELARETLNFRKLTLEFEPRPLRFKYGCPLTTDCGRRAGAMCELPETAARLVRHTRSVPSCRSDS
jgi:hypothetical protein